MRTVNPIRHDPFTILKSNDLVIGGYASIEMVDKQNDLITLEALKESVGKYMKITKFRNVMTNHSNVQVGEVIPQYRDKNGRLWKTDVDDVGFFVVIKMREDIEKAKEVGREIRDGSLRSFSIGGQALEKKKKNHKEYGEYNEISKLELHEVTICEKGINPEAKFDILKMEKGEKMDAVTKALEELNKTLDGVNNISKRAFLETLNDYKEGKASLDDVKETAEKDISTTKGKLDIDDSWLKRLVEEEIFTRPELNSMINEHNEGSFGSDFMDNKSVDINKTTENNIKNIEKNTELTSNGGTKMTDVEKEEYMDTEEEDTIEAQNPNIPEEEEMKSKPDLATGQVEAGNAGEMVDDSHPQLDAKYMAKFEDQSTLDLSAENLEKAYAEFKAEQLEKMAYEKVKGNFQSRFDSEIVSKTEEIEKANYDAKAEVAELRKQFTDLLENLKTEEETVIRKQEEVVAELNIPNSDEIAKMDWSDINALMERLEGQI